MTSSVTEIKLKVGDKIKWRTGRGWLSVGEVLILDQAPKISVQKLTNDFKPVVDNARSFTKGRYIITIDKIVEINGESVDGKIISVR
jgi:hypothetical protein